jgi:hypothetical protein
MANEIRSIIAAEAFVTAPRLSMSKSLARSRFVWERTKEEKPSLKGFAQTTWTGCGKGVQRGGSVMTPTWFLQNTRSAPGSACIGALSTVGTASALGATPIRE